METLQPLEHKLLFTVDGYTAEMCIEPESLKLAYQLRYEAYLAAGGIAPNPERQFTDPYDWQSNVRTYLIWYDGRPMASVRSLTYSAAYDWQLTSSIVLFDGVVADKLGEKTPVMESNRYVVDPQIKGR